MEMLWHREAEPQRAEREKEVRREGWFGLGEEDDDMVWREKGVEACI